MKLSIVFLVGASLAQNQITFSRQDGSSNSIDAIPGACRDLGGAPIRSVSVPPGLVVQFFDGDSCRGNQVAFGIRDNFHLTETPNTIKSIRALTERGPSPNNNTAYYSGPWHNIYEPKRS